MKITYRIDGLQCASCAARMEKVLVKTAGIKSASIIFMTGKLTMEIDGDEESIRAEAEKKIRKIEPHVKLMRV